jgi:hypothetical protein
MMFCGCALAQQEPPLQLNRTYVCGPNITIVVQRCEGPAGNERCTLVARVRGQEAPPMTESKAVLTKQFATGCRLAEERTDKGGSTAAGPARPAQRGPEEIDESKLEFTPAPNKIVADQTEQMFRRPPDREAQRQFLRCLVLGGTQVGCLNRAMTREMSGFTGGLLGEGRRSPPGVYLTGIFTGQGGFKATFIRDRAVLGCGRTEAAGNLTLVRGAAGMNVRLFDTGADSEAATWQRQRVVFTLRPDGKLTLPGTVRVTGPVCVGTRRVEETTTRWDPALQMKRSTTETVDRCIYETQTFSCTPVALAPTGKVAPKADLAEQMAGGLVGAVQSLANIASGTKDPMGRVVKSMAPPQMPEPGLAMDGTFAMPGGLMVEFEPAEAVLTCGEAMQKVEYRTRMAGGRILVRLGKAESAMEMEWRPDGALAGSGTVEVRGRRIVGIKQDGAVGFQPMVESCAVGVLQPQ